MWKRAIKMKKMNAKIAIAMTEATAALDKSNGIEENIKIAMRITKDHWICSDPDQQFYAALAAVVGLYGDESPEADRIEWECNKIKKAAVLLDAAQSGVIDDIDQMIKDLKKDAKKYEPIHILKIWDEL